jgi:hypothetical protein
MKILKLTLLALGWMGLAACSHMPISTMISLRNFDFVEFDPAQLQIAVRLPDALEPLPGEAKLSVSFWSDGQEKDRITEQFNLSVDEGQQHKAQLARFQKQGNKIFAFSLKDNDVERVRALQTKGRAMRKEATGQGQGKGHLELQINVKSCRHGDLPSGPLMMVIYLKPDAATSYLVFLDDIELRQTASDAKVNLEAYIPPCSKLSTRAP